MVLPRLIAADVALEHAVEVRSARFLHRKDTGLPFPSLFVRRETLV